MELGALLQFKSIKTKLVFAFLTLGILPVLIVGVLAFLRSSAALETRAGEKMSLQAQGTMDTIDRNLAERYVEVQAFAASPAARGTALEVTEAANLFTRNSGFYDLMIIADLDGRIVAANTVDAEGRSLNTSSLIGSSVKGEDWFEQCARGGIRAGEAYSHDLEEDKSVARLHGSRGLALNFSAPVYDE